MSTSSSGEKQKMQVAGGCVQFFLGKGLTIYCYQLLICSLLFCSSWRWLLSLSFRDATFARQSTSGLLH